MWVLVINLPLCYHMDFSSPGSFVHGILQTRILEGMCFHALLQGIFLEQGLNPHLLCFLHWQMGYLPLAPPGQPINEFKNQEEQTGFGLRYQDIHTDTHQNPHFDIVAELFISESQEVKQYYNKNTIFFHLWELEISQFGKIYPMRIRRWNKALITYFQVWYC